MRLKDAPNIIIFEDKNHWLFLIYFIAFLYCLNIVSFLHLERNNFSVCFRLPPRLFHKLRSSLIIFLSISMHVILPISFLLSRCCCPYSSVSHSVPSSRCFLSHYVPALLLSFVETPACICTGTRLFTLLIFLVLSPYRFPPSSCEYDIS